ncbi:hypothetical protein YC2023_063645 [Brassica napus]
MIVYLRFGIITHRKGQYRHAKANGIAMHSLDKKTKTNDITRCTRLFLHRGAIMKQQDQQKR